MLIKTAEYKRSSKSLDSCPPGALPEYAFIGRSNVGKSSLINMLTGRRKLALTSSTPGKTLLINHFLINDSWWIVDLPGYGYAQRGKQVMAELKRMIEGYVLRRQQLTCLFMLVDIRHEPQRKDLDFITFLGENQVPFALVFTKADKLPRLRKAQAVEAYKQVLSEQWEELPPLFVTSASTGEGRDALLGFIEETNKATQAVAE